MFGPKYATITRRFLANLIDQIICAILIFSLGYTINLISPQLSKWLYNFGKNFYESLMIVWLYYALIESSKLQASLGKMIFKLKVADYQEKKISFIRATVRFFSIFITLAIPLFIGFIMANFTKRKRMLHDKISATVVIQE